MLKLKIHNYLLWLYFALFTVTVFFLQFVSKFLLVPHHHHQNLLPVRVLCLGLVSPWARPVLPAWLLPPGLSRLVPRPSPVHILPGPAQLSKVSWVKILFI